MTILLSSAISEKLLNYANVLLSYFVKDFEDIYGQHMVSHNIHGLIHVAKDYKRYGQLDLCSCFVFENYMKTLKQMLRKHEKPLEQVIKRYQEKNENEIIDVINNKKQYATVLNYEHCNGPMINNTCGPQYLKFILHNKININTRTSSDIFILTTSKEVVHIKNIAHCSVTKKVVVIGYTFKNKQLFYDKPIKSSKLDIFTVHNLSKDLKYWKTKEIKKRWFYLLLERNILCFLFYILNLI